MFPAFSDLFSWSLQRSVPLATNDDLPFKVEQWDPARNPIERIARAANLIAMAPLPIRENSGQTTVLCLARRVDRGLSLIFYRLARPGHDRVERQLELRKHCQPFLQCYGDFHARQVGADAAVNAQAERDTEEMGS
jgi:hypothetical protein